jgi:hypothetical protein
MRFTSPGEDCIFCACRHTRPDKMTALEVAAAIFVPYVVYKCPHCLNRFWRLHTVKLVIYSTLVLATAGGVYLLLR